MLSVVKTVFAPLQFFLLPGTIVLLVIFIYLFLINNDKAAGLVLLLGLIIIVDSWMNTGIWLPGLKFGSVRYSELILAILIWREMQQAAFHNHENPIRKSLSRLFIAYLLLFFLSVLKSDNFTVHFFRTFRDIGITSFIIFYISSSGFESQKGYQKFSNYLIVLGIIITIGSFQAFFFDKIFIDSIHYEKGYHSQSHGRYASFFTNPNMLAAFYILILPLTILSVLKADRLIKKGVLLMIFLFFAFGLYKTFTRAAFIAFPISFLPILFFKTDNISIVKKIATLTMICIFISILSPRMFDGISGRMSTIQDEDEVKASRLMIWTGTLQLIKENYLFGFGMGENKFINAAKKAIRLGGLNENVGNALIIAQMPHSSYLYIFFFMGFFALIIFCLMFLIFIKNTAMNFIRHEKYDMKYMQLAIFSGVLGFMVAIIFDFQLFIKSTASTFWCFVGLGVALLNKVETSKSDTSHLNALNIDG